MNIENIIQEKLNKAIEDGSLESMIEKQVAATLENITNDLFRSYGKIGEELKKIVGEKLELSLQTLDISAYSIMVNHAVEQAINTTALENAKGLIQKNIAEVLWVMDNKTWKLSEIVGKYIDSLYEGDKVAYEIEETQYGSTWIYIGEPAERSSYSSYTGSKVKNGYMIYVDKESKIFSVTNKGKILDPRVEKPSHWEMFLMNLWANRCTIEIDEDAVEDMISQREYAD